MLSGFFLKKKPHRTMSTMSRSESKALWRAEKKRLTYLSDVAACKSSQRLREKSRDGASSVPRLRTNYLFDGPVHPGALFGGAGQAAGIVGQHRIDKVLDHGIVQVGVGR